MTSKRAFMIGLVVLVLSLTACIDVQCAAGVGKTVDIDQQQADDDGEDLLWLIGGFMVVCFAVAGLAAGAGGLGGAGR